MPDDDTRILPVVKGRVQCRPDKRAPVDHCRLCIHCREFRVRGRFVKSPSLAYCTRTWITENVDLNAADAVRCADRQGGGFHSITSIIS